MDCALSVLISGIIAAGVLGALLRGWSIALRLLALESEQGKQSVRLTSFEKSNAAKVRWAKADREQEELEAVARRVNHNPEFERPPF